MLMFPKCHAIRKNTSRIPLWDILIIMDVKILSLSHFIQTLRVQNPHGKMSQCTPKCVTLNTDLSPTNILHEKSTPLKWKWKPNHEWFNFLSAAVFFRITFSQYLNCMRITWLGSGHLLIREHRAPVQQTFSCQSGDANFGETYYAPFYAW